MSADLPERDAFAHEGPDLSSLNDDDISALVRASKLERHDMSLAADSRDMVRRCERLVSFGLLNDMGLGVLSDGDGFAIQPEREVPCYEITAAGRAAIAPDAPPTYEQRAVFMQRIRELNAAGHVFVLPPEHDADRADVARYVSELLPGVPVTDEGLGRLARAVRGEPGGAS